MQKFCVLILLCALVPDREALPQTKWSRPIRNPQGQVTRDRRQFPFGDWVPLNQPCPTCRQFADPVDVGLRGENIGLTPPRPPTVTRQIHGEANFFPQDESSILSVPPPPPSAVPRVPVTNANGNFQNLQFSGFGQQFNSPLPTQQIFPQTQQIQFLPETFLPNQNLLVNKGNQQIPPALSTQNTFFAQDNQGKQQLNNGKVPKFNSDFKTQKGPENIVLEQNKRPGTQQQASQFFNKPKPFTPSQQTLSGQQQTQQFVGQQQPQVFVGQQQQQAFAGQQRQQVFNGQQQQQVFSGQQQPHGFVAQKQQQSLNSEDSILTPPPVPNNLTQNIAIPGLNKEEIQLLYVPVETLRQRGNFQEQLLTQQPQNIQFHSRPSPSPRPAVSLQPTEQTTTKLPKGHFVTQNGNNQGQSISTPSQTFPTTVTPSNLLLQQLSFHQTPQPFVSATPVTSTLKPFVTSSPVSQKFSPFTPETTLSQLVSLSPNTIQFSQSDFGFGTTPQTLITPEAFQEQIINGKTQFEGFKDSAFQTVTQQPVQQQKQEQGERQPQQNTAFFQEQQKELEIQNQIPSQPSVDQQQVALQKQQEQQLLQQQKEKDLQEQFLLKQRQQKELESQRVLQQQRQKDLEEQRYLQQQRQKEREEQQRVLQQQRQKELEQQRFLQQQQRQKEVEEQRFLQQQRQKELEQQRFLQQQREKELENQRRLQLIREKEFEEKRSLQQLKQQKEEEQRLLRVQQQQKEYEEQQRMLRQQQDEQRLLRQQQEEQRLLRQQQEQQQQLIQQKHKQENFNQQQLEFYQQQQQQQKHQHQQQQHHQQQQLQQHQQQQQQHQLQQQQQQQKQQLPQQGFQQSNRHTLPANDQLNSISQLEKESEPDQLLVPHQPPLSVFYKGFDGAEPKIVDVLRELRRSNTITVLDQYFEKMPKVFVGPAGLIPPAGYGRFELPYLSNIETNRIERKIDRLPFFVAPLNFVPPPGYAKIPFPAPHVGSVVVSSESNPAMRFKTVEKENNLGSIESSTSGSFPMVGPELPGLINSLETETTTIKPTFPSTPSLPQTTAQLRNRRPNTSLYRTQSRKPNSRTRPQTTSRPEEEVTQSIQKIEVSTESGARKPFNRFLNRRRQQSRTTTESSVKGPQEGKTLENRHYSVEVYHQQKNTNQVPRQQHKTDLFQDHKLIGHSEENLDGFDRTTPGGHGIFEVSPTPGFHKDAEGHRSEYSDVNLQTFEDGPLPTGSAKTITQELYRPNAIQNNRQRLPEIASTSQPEQGSTLQSFFEEQGSAKLSAVNPTVAFISNTAEIGGASSVESTPNTEFEKQDSFQATSERSYATESPRTESSYTPGLVTVSGQQPTQSFGISDEQYTSAFAEISKHHHIPGPTESSRRQQSKFQDQRPTSEISIELQAPISKEYSQEQEFESLVDVKPTQNAADFSNGQFDSTRTSYEQHVTGFSTANKDKPNSDFPDVSSSQVSPTAPGASQEQYTTGLSINSQEITRHSEEERRPSFIGFQGTQSSAEISGQRQPQYFPSSTAVPTQEYHSVSQSSESNEYIDQNLVSVTPHSEVTEQPSSSTYQSVSEESVQINDQKPTTEVQSQSVDDNLSNVHRAKLPNPSIVRVRTRVRGKQRGQVNFAASQSTTQTPFVRSKVEIRNYDNADQEHATKATNTLRDYQPVKTSKYNTYRGLKKPARPSTTEATTEQEQRSNVYTVRPPRRPLNPSTVSTKRIRRPTTPLSTLETATEAFGYSTSHSDESEFAPSGVSNDVYYEHSSLSPIRQKFRQHFGTAEHKSDIIPVISTTAYPSAVPPLPTIAHDASFHEEVNVAKDLGHDVLDNSEKYPDWNPSESGIDVSGIVLTTIRTPGEDHPEEEEPKKSQDSKKAFDPDLEKKSGRRRVRVRVHKRPHENFETAESQNLRTVANVLVPPTSTYKPNDENNFHQLAKNSDFSFGGQKLFGQRSREYFRKRLNLTHLENTDESKGDEPVPTGPGNDATGKKVSGFVRKAEKVQKNNLESNPVEVSDTTAAGGDGTNILRTKYRGYVRKIVKHKLSSKEADSELNHSAENEENEGKQQENVEPRPRPHFRGFNQTSRFNGTRHKTLVRLVKKNKIRPHEVHQESTSEEVHQSEEPSTEQKPENETESSQVTKEAEETSKPYPVYRSTQPPETTQSSQTPETEKTEEEETEKPEVEEQKPEPPKPQSESEPQETQQTQQPQDNVLQVPQKSKFFQSLRPGFQRPTYTGLPRTREPSTTEHVPEVQEKRDGPIRPRFGRPGGFGTTGRTEERKRINEYQSEQSKNKNLHTLEVKKYLRTKSREGVFSQFSKNRYHPSEKPEAAPTTEEDETEEKDITTPITKNENFKVQSTSSETELPTTQTFVTVTDSAEDETTKHDEPELQVTTTEAIEKSTEEESTEEDEKEITRSDTTTETRTEVPTTIFGSSSSVENLTSESEENLQSESVENLTSESVENLTESKTEAETTTETIKPEITEIQPDLYRFSKSSFSFDETEKFTGTKNRAHVRNITADIIENTASFSAPGVEKRVIPQPSDENTPQTTEPVTENQKTEQTTGEYEGLETTTEYPEKPETETPAATEAVTKVKAAKLIKTSTTTKVSHETEICYKGKCIRTKSENPDEDLKLLVDSASTMKIEKSKT